MVQQRSTNLMGGSDTDFLSYSFSGKPLKHKHVYTATGKPVHTEVYTYTYDSAERLKEVYHKLNNQAEVLLANNTYDELGRLSGKQLHGDMYGTTYAYNIRSRLTGIIGSKFSQDLYYNTGNGTPCYNGNISSMTWKDGDGLTRGYKYAYDGLGRLTAAAYGEGASIGSNADRFTERVTGYDSNGNITGLQRYGQTSVAGYGLVDNLSFTLDGNRLNRVDDAVTASAYNGGFEFKDGASQAGEYAYDANGNLTKDLNKNIIDIQYNVLNLPSRVTFGDGSTITYTYAADGTKLRTVHAIGGITTTTDYCGNVVYENGVAKLLLTEVGYITLSDKKYHYYLQDHQGNNRVVIDQNGSVEETNHYYPFGGVFASSENVQPYKYNGKELDTKKGLNWYDYGARQYDAALGRFHTNDRFAEKYYSMSTYQYGANNPVRNVDVNGDSIIILHHSEGMHMGMLIQNEESKWQYYSVNGNNVYVGGKFSGGRKFDDIAVGNFNSPQEFMESSYNSKGDRDDKTINSYGYAEGYLIPATSEQDEIMRNTFSNISKNEKYNLLDNNCSTTVQRSLNAAGFVTTPSMEYYLPKQSPLAPNISIKLSHDPVPESSFRKIIKNNPNGQYIQRIKKY